MIDEALARWRAAGLLDDATIQRLQQFEAARGPGPGRSRWPVILALAAGGVMVTAGLLLFVAAHWAELAPPARVGLLVLTVLLLHGGGAVAATGFPALATTLHAVGTAALGAAIFLIGQTFHLEQQWPAGLLLWALGAAAAAWLLHDWPQVLATGLLAPAWVVAEWVDRGSTYGRVAGAVPFAALLLLALVYLHARRPGTGATHGRTALGLAGAVAVIPLAIALRLTMGEAGLPFHWEAPAGFQALSWTLALGLPVGVGVALRGRALVPVLGAAAWVGLGVLLGTHAGGLGFVWGGLGAIGLAASGVAEESRLRINVGLGAFAVTVLLFYFSSVSDRLGRSLSLLVGGILFLGLGLVLERLRRRLVAGLRQDTA